jgi:hypothetical protein
MTHVRMVIARTLSLNSMSVGGANASAFAFFTANNGFSNCFAGMLLAPKSFCYMAVGLAPGATPPASATLEFLARQGLRESPRSASSTQGAGRRTVSDAPRCV